MSGNDDTVLTPKMHRRKERNNRMLADHKAGMSFRAIGKKYGLSGSQASISVRRAQRLAEDRSLPTQFMEKAGVRVYLALSKYAKQEGLSPDTKLSLVDLQDLSMLRNWGSKSTLRFKKFVEEYPDSTLRDIWR